MLANMSYGIREQALGDKFAVRRKHFLHQCEKGGPDEHAWSRRTTLTGISCSTASILPFAKNATRKLGCVILGTILAAMLLPTKMPPRDMKIRAQLPVAAP